MSATAGDSLAGHRRWMAAALAFGLRGMGRTAPNPAVGALVVKAGILLGRGVTAPGGRPHAEPSALAEAGAAARGATLYVTLEPCSHVGRTPPCTSAIIAAGIAEVVYALGDPDARVTGRGLAQLRAAGIAVTGPVLESHALRDHRGHLLRVTEGRPSVTVKLAETPDGFAAAAPGDDRLLITGTLANAAVHRMRALHDAVLVGIGTVLADDPALTVRLPGCEAKPVRIVLDGQLRLDLDSTLARTLDRAPVIVVARPGADAGRRRALEARGVTILEAPGGPGGLDLPETLRLLGAYGLTRVFCEGGPQLASALVAGGLADAVMLLIGERPLCRMGLPALSDDARRRLADPACYALAEDRLFAADRLRRFERI